MRAVLDRWGPAAKLVVGPALVLLLGAAAAYAAVRPALGHGGERREPGHGTAAPTIPVAPSGAAALRIVDHPRAISTHTTAHFRLLAAGEPELRCRLDGRRARPCGTRVVYRGLPAGPHSFLVAARRPGRRVVHADFGWRILEPEPFTVAPRAGTVGPLYPGAAPSAIPVVITNPNPVAITITALRVAAGGGPAGCDAAGNLALTAPDLGPGPLRIPAHGSLSLPSATMAAPTIALRELGVNQDACQGARFELSFSGSAGA